MAQIEERAALNPAFDDLSLAHLVRRQTEKWRRHPADVLPAFVAEMDFPLSPAIRDTLVEAVRSGVTGYAWASPELGQALGAFARQRFDWEIDPAHVVLIPDVMFGVTEFLRAAGKPGDGVVINPPVYPPFFSHIPEAGLRVIEAPLARGPGGYELDLDAIERAFDQGARFYLFCNPHNPTGRVFSREQIAGIAELAERHDAIVIADEIHAPLVMPGYRHVPFLSIGGAVTEHAVALVSASKGWNIPGLKCAQLVVGSDRMRALVSRMPDQLVGRVGNLGVLATIAAYRDSVDWLDELLSVLDRNRHLLARWLEEDFPAIGYHRPQGTYLAWLDCRALHLPVEPVDFFLQQGKVSLGPGPMFGRLGAGYVRVTMGTSARILREIVDRMRGAIIGV